MAITRLSVATQNAVLSQILMDLDAGGAAGAIAIYTGSMPASVDTAVAGQTLLGTLAPSFPAGTISAGALTFSAITQDPVADATGSATWARLSDSLGVAVMDVNVTSTAGTGALKLNTTSIVAGGPIAITSFILTVG